MAVTEEKLREAALACFDNAKDLCEEAKILEEHGRGARAVALAVIGLEEFAKALAYTVAALSHGTDTKLPPQLSLLSVHEVKHLVAASAEAAQIVTRDWVDGVYWQTGYSPSREEPLAAMFRQFAEGGLPGLLGSEKEARQFYRSLQGESRVTSDLSDGDTEYLVEPYAKKAALYADLGRDGILRTPGRVADRARSQILELEWFLEQYGHCPPS